MKGIFFILITLCIVASLRQKGRKQSERQSSESGKSIFDDWTAMFSSEDAIENLSMEEVCTDSAYKNANVNEHQSNMRFDNFDNSKDSNQTKDNDREFNLKRAVIYSAVLDRPYI